ncbi:MAG: multidrug efflux SMR transporter [Mariprofundaceae bacterium]|nr:multidrug efflux SMR transporter [Mariprofundaceae bacterium]
MAYLYLLAAIIAEVAATSALRAAEEFTRLVPSLIVVAGYGIAFYFLMLVMRTIPVGITYAVWSGLGMVLVTVAGAVLYRQIPDLPAMIGLGLIVAGVAVIHLFSESTSL